jgi:hypothetical protein
MQIEDVVNSEMMRILVRISYERLVKIQEDVRDMFDALGGRFDTQTIRKRFKSWDVGRLNGDIKGYLIVPKLPSLGKYFRKHENEVHISKVEKYGTFGFFNRFLPDDKATIIGQDSLRYNVNLQEIHRAERRAGRNMTDIVRMYFGRGINPGTRVETSASVAILLNDEADNGNIRNSFYDGKIYFLRQTISPDTVNTSTTPLYVIGNEHYQSFEFFWQLVNHCRGDVREAFMQRWGNPESNLAGVLRFRSLDPDLDEAVIRYEHLTTPYEWGIEKPKIFAEAFEQKA